MPPEPFPKHFFGVLEPVFPVSGSTGLSFPSQYHEFLADYFCHCIARDPNDLRSHVRRIMLEREHSHGAGLYPALIDLFIALGQRGARLRLRMLEFAKDALQPQEYHLLRDAFAAGLDAGHAPTVFGSMLAKGVEGKLRLVVPCNGGVREGALRDVLLEAREYLEYSQLDEAREVLERAVLQEPQRLELQLELLDIYRSTRDQGNFFRMSQELEDAAVPVAEAWRELAQHFRSFNA